MGEILVIGAGVVGVSVALHLRQRGHDVLVADRLPPGRGTSFGNAGIIQREAVSPYAFPRRFGKLLEIALGRGLDVRYHLSALPAYGPALLRYWWNSAPQRHARIAEAYALLIARSTAEHAALAERAGAAGLIRKQGWLDTFRSEAALAEGGELAARAGREHGVRSEVIDGAELARREPHLTERLAGAIHWRESWTVTDPGALVAAYARALEQEGGAIEQGDVTALAQDGAGWRAAIDGRIVAAERVVIAAGPWSEALTRGLGYRLPLFVKRGYHMHYGMDPARPLNNWLGDLGTGYLIVPMRGGIRLTTGVEIARLGAPATPAQLDRAEAVARRLFPLGPRLDPEPWLGNRPCTADMLPVIGPATRHRGLWFAFGHAHHGLTLGPVTGRLLAELMAGDTPCVDPAPFAPARFAQ